MNKAEIVIHDRPFVPYIPEQEINKNIRRVAKEIFSTIDDDNPLFVVILNGAFMFASELFKYLDKPYEVQFTRVSSYSGTSSTFRIKEVMPLSVPVENRTVIIVEDLIDSGFTMVNLKKKYLEQGAKSVYIATMLLKPDALINDLQADFVGLEIEPKFIVGYGLDFDGYGRMLKDIYQIKE